MKKTIAALALTFAFAAPALAEQTTEAQQPADQAQAQQTQEQAPQVHTYGKVGRIIGRIIGDIARGERRGGRDGRDRWGRGRGRGYPQPQQRVACYAQNRRGEIFQAIGYDVYRTQADAMNQCYDYSVACAEAGCRYY